MPCGSFRDLERQLDDVDASQIRPVLMSTYERLLHDRAVADIELPAIEEFFGHHEDAAQRRVEDYRRLSESSVACRYVIEMIAAKPPRGTRFVADHAVQSLLATAVSIINLGQISDLVHFRLTPAADAVLFPTGVLMATAADHVRLHDSFAASVRLGDIERSAARRDSSLSPVAHSAPFAELTAQIETAHLADHGCVG